MGRYEAVKQESRKTKVTYLKAQRKVQLYTLIWRDISAIVIMLLPNEMAITVNSHLKSILYNLIELKTGNRPDKI